MKEIPLRKSKLVALVDDEDLEKVSQYNWRFTPEGYVWSTLSDSTGKSIIMSRLIMDCPDHLEVDHIDHNPLDNRKEKLRIVTHQQNSFNRRKFKNNKSGYKGVVRSPNPKYPNKWWARITLNGKMKFLGSFDTPELAAVAYNEAAINLFGEFAHPNVIPVQPVKQVKKGQPSSLDHFQMALPI